jgi:Gpi18-like mannosyltransferase
MLRSVMGSAPVQAAASPSGLHGLSSRRWAWVWTIAAALVLRAIVLEFESGDYRFFLSPWYDFFVDHGRWRGLGELEEEFASYPPLYMYLISLSTLLPIPRLYAVKSISVASDFLAAWFVWRLLRRAGSSGFKPWGAATTFLLLPTVVMNSALWGQCDVMYTCGFLASLLYLLEGRPVAALVAFGFSCSLKPQAVFWCPLLAGLLVSPRLPWKWLWVPLVVYAVCGVPQMLAGKAPLLVLTQWARLHNSSTGILTYGATNWYQWLSNPPGDVEVWELTGMAMTLLATGLFVAWMMRPAPPNRDRWLISLALLSVLFPPFLLPGMHERYFFPADVLSLLYAFSVPGGWVVAVWIQFASTFSYCPFLFQREPVPREWLAVAVVAALALVVTQLRSTSQPGGSSRREEAHSSPTKAARAGEVSLLTSAATPRKVL